MALSLLTVVTFLAAVLVVAGIYSIVSDLFLRDRLRLKQRVDEEFSPRKPTRPLKSALFKDLKKAGVDPALLEGERRTLAQKYREMVEQSGLPISPKQLSCLALGCGLLLGALTGLILYVTGSGGTLLGGGLVAVVGMAIPIVYVHFKRKRRLDKLLGQLPDALDLMARAIRAGQTMSQALQAIADEFQAPIGPEFAYCYEQQNLGLPAEMAFQDMARRTGLLEIKIFILAMMVQRQTGGNLAELLDKLSNVVRERFRVKGKIRVLTAEGRIQALVLLALPPLVFLMMLFVNREYTVVLLDHPNALILVGLSMGLGTLWIRKIVNFDF